jgi:hypothetical protein
MDFTIKAYRALLNSLRKQDYQFQTFSDYLQKPASRTIILRHDVDKLPQNALRIAQIENLSGIKGTYYFRIVPKSFDEEIIRQIAELGHEIGYHYEDLSLAAGSMKNEKLKIKNDDEYNRILFERGIESFQKNLETLRKITPVKTICMHGSPVGKYDNRDLWKVYDYKDFGIIGEPYLDVDFSQVLYLTDTGRRWNGGSVSVRDKVEGGGLKAEGDLWQKAEGRRRKVEDSDRRVGAEESYYDWKVKPKPGSLMNMTEKGVKFQSRYNFRSTNDIIRVAEKGELPDRIMMTFHPQRWTDKTLPWIKELLWQNLKNVAKGVLVKIKQ